MVLKIKKAEETGRWSDGVWGELKEGRGKSYFKDHVSGMTTVAPLPPTSLSLPLSVKSRSLFPALNLRAFQCPKLFQPQTPLSITVCVS